MDRQPCRSLRTVHRPAGGLVEGIGSARAVRRVHFGHPPQESHPDSSRREQVRTLLIVDDARSAHGQRMARVLLPTTHPVWLLPTLRLADELLSTSAEIIAMPLRVRGGSERDRFTAAVSDAVRTLMRRGVLVFVARGAHPNPLADAGHSVFVSNGAPRSASEACVEVAECWAYVARSPLARLLGKEDSNG